MTVHLLIVIKKLSFGPVGKVTIRTLWSARASQHREQGPAEEEGAEADRAV
jgi:hypothetical protein